MCKLSSRSADRVIHAVEFSELLCDLSGEILGELPEGHDSVSVVAAIHNDDIRRMVNCSGCREGVERIESRLRMARNRASR